jgi:hypothetical protein
MRIEHPRELFSLGDRGRDEKPRTWIGRLWEDDKRRTLKILNTAGV